MTMFDHQLTVGEVIDYLRTLDPYTVVVGLGSKTGSYRGYYDEVAIEPNSNGVYAQYIIDEMTSKLGTTMTGYKGGEYPYNSDCGVWVALYGCTGPSLEGFEVDGDKVIAILGEDF